MKGATRWTVGGGRVLGPSPFFIAGIVNASPDSFYDGGRHPGVEAAVAHGLKLAAEGAHILDVGGESTRPGAAEVSEAEELARVLPVVRELARAFGSDRQGGPVISVDTYKAGVARQCIGAGATMVNDISACRFDPALAEVLAEHQPGYVLMHSLGRPGTMQDDPRYQDVVAEIIEFFEERLEFLERAGLPRDRVALDPGIGFGKTLAHNLAILAGIERFFSLGLPVYLGLSNKSVWGKLLGLELGERAMATQVATALMAARGVPVHRVHEVADTRRTLAIVSALGGGFGGE